MDNILGSHLSQSAFNLVYHGSCFDPLVFKQESYSCGFKKSYRTKTNSATLNLNTICPYYTMFPLEFPLKILRRAGERDWVLDPFCGRGTTLFAARLLGLNSVGIDSNPVAAAISAAKLVDTNAERVIGVAENILESFSEPEQVPEGEFWERCYHHKTLRDICVFREKLKEGVETQEEIVLRALILGILHGPLRKGKPTYFSNQMPRTYATKPEAAIRYWHKKGLLEPPHVDLLDTIKRRAKYSLEVIPAPAGGEVYCGDARFVDQIIVRRDFKWIITSPPYFGMRTYHPDQWLRNWFLGGEPKVIYSSPGHLPHNKDEFIGGLAAVWKNLSKVCSPGARLIIRFGSLPSEPVDAFGIIKSSLFQADAGWKIKTKKDAGSASRGNRQSEQFFRAGEKALPEFDLYARLEV